MLYVLQDSITDYIAYARSDRPLTRPELDLLSRVLSEQAEFSEKRTVRDRITDALDRYAGDTGIRLTLDDGAAGAFIRF